MKRIALLGLVLVTVAALGGAVNGARAAFPGANGRIVYEALASGGGHVDLFVVNDDGLERLVLNTGAGEQVSNELRPAWSADGRKIAFASNRLHSIGESHPLESDYEIYVADVVNNGTGVVNVRRVTSNSAQDLNPTWSPDGTRVAFDGDAGEDLNNDIFIVNSGGTGLRRLTFEGDVALSVDPSWSPDGTKIVYTRTPDGAGPSVISVVDLDGIPQPMEEFVFGSTPSWSPDGTRITFQSNFYTSDSEIFVMQADGTGRTNVTNHPQGDGFPAWSPDGTKIAFHRIAPDFLSASIYVMNADGSGQTAIAEGGAPDWQPLSTGPPIPPNTPTGSDVVVQPVDTTSGTRPVTLTFENVTSPGNTGLTTSTTGPTAPTGFALGSPPVYHDLVTTATYSGSIEICISYDGVTFDGDVPRLFHSEPAGVEGTLVWVDRTSSVDETNRIVCGVVTSLSPFALFAPAGPPEDSAPPTTAAVVSPQPNAAGWNNEDVTLTLVATDEVGGSGIDEIRYTIGGTTTVVNADSAAVTLTGEGVLTISYYATDSAGNAEAPQSVTVKIDRTPPALRCTASPGRLWPPNHRLRDVNVTVVVADELSGPGTFTLAAAESSEPDNGPGDGNTTGDIREFGLGLPDTDGLLRAERSGGGMGRVYELRYRGHDLAGNTATCVATVVVPQHASEK